MENISRTIRWRLFTFYEKNTSSSSKVGEMKWLEFFKVMKSSNRMLDIILVEITSSTMHSRGFSSQWWCEISPRKSHWKNDSLFRRKSRLANFSVQGYQFRRWVGAVPLRWVWTTSIWELMKNPTIKRNHRRKVSVDEILLPHSFLLETIHHRTTSDCCDNYTFRNLGKKIVYQRGFRRTEEKVNSLENGIRWEGGGGFDMKGSEKGLLLEFGFWEKYDDVGGWDEGLGLSSGIDEKGELDELELERREYEKLLRHSLPLEPFGWWLELLLVFPTIELLPDLFEWFK